MLPSNGKFVLPNIYEKTLGYNLKTQYQRNQKPFPVRLNSHLSHHSESKHPFQGSIQEPLLFTNFLEAGHSSNDSLGLSLVHNSILEKQGSKFRKNDSLLKESRFSIRDNSFSKKDAAPNRSKVNRKSENISKSRKRTMLQFMRKNGFSEKFGKVSFKEPLRKSPLPKVRLEQANQFRPFRDHLQNVRRPNNASPAKDPRWKKRNQQKENRKQKGKRDAGKLKEVAMSVEAYSREVFRQAFREIDSIFYLFANLYEVGSGSYAVAYSAVEKKTGKKFVLKTFKFKDFVKKSYVSRFMVGGTGQFKRKNEVHILNLLESRYVPKLFNVCFDKQRIYMIQQKAGKRTLKAFLKKYQDQITVSAPLTPDEIHREALPEGARGGGLRAPETGRPRRPQVDQHHDRLAQARPLDRLRLFDARE